MARPLYSQAQPCPQGGRWAPLPLWSGLPASTLGQLRSESADGALDQLRGMWQGVWPCWEWHIESLGAWRSTAPPRPSALKPP